MTAEFYYCELHGISYAGYEECPRCAEEKEPEQDPEEILPSIY